jgi:predicted AAA+ superfamily ATPase
MNALSRDPSFGTFQTGNVIYALIGPRQVGKTTIARPFKEKIAGYHLGKMPHPSLK